MITVLTGADALVEIKRRNFDLALIDIKLPDMNGLEVLSEIQMHTPATQTIVITGFRIDQLTNSILTDGESHILPIPPVMNNLLEKAEEIKRLGEGIVLVVDGNPGIAANIDQELRVHGYSTYIAQTDTDIFIENFEDEHDFLILDMQLPVVQALAKYAYLKKHQSSLPTLLIYRKEMKGMVNSNVLRSHDVTGCLFKPFDMKELITLVNNKTNSHGIV